MTLIDLIDLTDLYDFTPSQLISFFDNWASQELKDSFMSALSDDFDLPESLDYNVREYAENSGLSLESVLNSLTCFLTTDEESNLVQDICTDYDINPYEDAFPNDNEDGVELYWTENDWCDEE